MFYNTKLQNQLGLTVTFVTQVLLGKVVATNNSKFGSVVWFKSYKE